MARPAAAAYYACEGIQLLIIAEGHSPAYLPSKCKDPSGFSALTLLLATYKNGFLAI